MEDYQLINRRKKILSRNLFNLDVWMGKKRNLDAEWWS